MHNLLILEKQIILGGGRQPFDPARDDGSTKWPCKRGDNMDLIDAWKKDKEAQGHSHLFLENQGDLMNADLDSTDYILGNPLIE